MVKHPDEIELLRLAAHAADRVVDAIAAGRLVGRTEADVSREVRAMLVTEGHDRADFAIVGSGPNSASPHHEASERVIEAGEPIVLDIGGPLGGYGSDTTPDDLGDRRRSGRRPDQGVPCRVRRTDPRPGRGDGRDPAGCRAEDVDTAARDVIAAAGFRSNFIHRTGHGIGLEPHEDPYLVAGNREGVARGDDVQHRTRDLLRRSLGDAPRGHRRVRPDGPDVLNRSDHALRVVSRRNLTRRPGRRLDPGRWPSRLGSTPVTVREPPDRASPNAGHTVLPTLEEHMVAALEAIGLTKQYRRGTLALSNVSLEVAPGSITALVGPNAAGKSTLIRTWVGFEQPTSGSVRVAGIDPASDPAAALRHVGYVPQQPALYRELTTADHLDLAAHLRPGFDRAVAERHLDYLAIPLRARATTLSGGQQAQVMLAVALGTRADVLLLDEPLASLDPLARSEFLTVLRTAVREGGSTALLSSHIVTDVEQVCDRLIVLGIGRVLLDDGLAHAVAGHGVRSGDAFPTAGGSVQCAVGHRHRPVPDRRGSAPDPGPDPARSPGRQGTFGLQRSMKWSKVTCPPDAARGSEAA